jgi:hypothetical protein
MRDRLDFRVTRVTGYEGVVNPELETPGAVFAEALRQWREALRPGDDGNAPPSPSPSHSTADLALDPE